MLIAFASAADQASAPPPSSSASATRKISVPVSKLRPSQDDEGDVDTTLRSLTKLPDFVDSVKVKLPPSTAWSTMEFAANLVGFVAPAKGSEIGNIVAEIEWSGQELSWSWSSAKATDALPEIKSLLALASTMVVDCTLHDGTHVEVRFTGTLALASSLPKAQAPGAVTSGKGAPGDKPTTSGGVADGTKETPASAKRPTVSKSQMAKYLIYFGTLPEDAFWEAVRRFRAGEPKLSGSRQREYEIMFGSLRGDELRAAVLRMQMEWELGRAADREQDPNAGSGEILAPGDPMNTPIIRMFIAECRKQGMPDSQIRDMIERQRKAIDSQRGYRYPQ